MTAMGARSVTNSTTNLTSSTSKSNAFEGFEHSLFTFKIMLLILIAVDIFFLGLFIPSTRDFTSIKFLILYGYLALILVGAMGIFLNAPRLLAPLHTVWILTLLVIMLVLLLSTLQYATCAWTSYFQPDSNIQQSCSWTFMETSTDAAIYVMILGLKLSQVFLCHIVGSLLYKAIRIQSFDARKHASESDDEDVMVVFERVSGGSSPGKVRDAAIA